MHKPPRIPCNLMIPGGLHTQTYSNTDLLRALTEYLYAQDKGEWTGAAKIGLNDFKDRGLWPANKPESIDSMQQAFGILDFVYFNGCLTRFVVLSMDEKPSNKPTQRGSTTTNLPHSGKQLLDDQEGLYCLIKVHPNRNSTKTPQERAQEYQDVLIHEMIHAYFEIYRCRCRLGCKTAGERWRGHTMQWFQAAQAIVNSRATRRTEPVASHDGPLIFQVEIRFERIMAKALLIPNPDPAPSNAEYARMGLSKKGVQDIIDSENEKKDELKAKKERQAKREKEREKERERKIRHERERARREMERERAREKERETEHERRRARPERKRDDDRPRRHGGCSRR